MPEPKTQCADCGAAILVATANKTGGRCLPCAKGTRASIDAGRRRAEEDKAFRASAVWKFWERLEASDFSELSPPEQVYLAVNELRGSVTNGGFRSYFSTFGERASAAEAGLVKLNADGPLQVFREARRVVGSSSASALNDPAIDRQLDELDRRFYAVADGLWDALQKFGVRQGFLPTPWPADADE